MRSKSRTGVLTLVAVFVCSAVAVASASAALPEFKPVPAKKKFTGTAPGAKIVFNNGTEVLECAKAATVGEVLSAKTIGKTIVTFTSCEYTTGGGSGCSVNSVGAKAGEIVTKPLVGELGTVKTTEAPSGVGLLLKPETEKVWTDLVEDRCWGANKITGSLAVEISTVGKKQITNKLVMSRATSGNREAIREITLDSGKLENPELVMFSSTATLESTDELKFEEALEVT